MVKEQQPRDERQKVPNPSRRRFLRLVTYTAGAVTAATVTAGARDLYDAVSYNHSQTSKFLPSEKQIQDAKNTTADYKRISEQLAKEGRINEIPQSVDPTAVQNAYRTIDINTQPATYFPDEFRKINERNSDLNKRATILLVAGLTSEIIACLSWGVGVRVDMQKTKPEKNPPFPVGFFLKKMPSGTAKTA